nr:MAG TPA: hypothetical protein [Caudoviricetes sp.]
MNLSYLSHSLDISSKTCVNMAFSQVFSFFKMHFKIQYATKNLTLFLRSEILFVYLIFSQRPSIDHL